MACSSSTRSAGISLDEATLDWLYSQRRTLAAAGDGEAPSLAGRAARRVEAEHVGLHGFESLRTAVDARFEEREFAWTPFLCRLLGGVATEVLEQALIDAGAIQALGFRYAGVVRAP